MASTGAIKAGRAFVELFVDNKKLVRGLRTAQREVARFGKNVTAIGKQVLVASTIAAAPLAFATKTYADFADQMAEVRAVTGTVGPAFNNLNEQAKELGRTTSFTAGQVAGAMTALGRAGFRSPAIKDAIGSVLDLARATATDLPLAAEIAAAAMRGFNLEASNTPQIADILVSTANNSAQTLTDLGESLKYVAPLASAAGESLSDTAAALGVLANNGIKGSMAGTSLARAFKNVAAGKGDKIFKDMGINIVDANGDLLKMSTILTNLGRQTQGLGSKAKLGIFETLFGRGSAAALKLSGPGQFEGMKKSLTDIEGAASKTAKTMDDVLGGSFRMVISAVEGVQIAIGESLAPMLRDISDTTITAAGAVTAWIKENNGFVVGLGAVVIAGLLAGGAMVALGVAIKGVALVAGVAATGLKAISAAIALVKLAAVGVGPALVNGLIKAFVFIELHPIGVILTVAAAAAVALMWALDGASKAMKSTSAEMERLRKAGDDERKTDQLRMERLEQLSKVQNKNAKQIKEASNLIADLSSHYDGLGLSINKTTGYISGMTGAQKKLNAEQRKAAELQVRAEIAAAKRDQQILSQKQEAGLGGNTLSIKKRWQSVKQFVGYSQSDKEVVAEYKAGTRVNQAKIAALQARLSAIQSGNKAALTGEQTEAQRIQTAIASSRGEGVSAGRSSDEAAKSLRRLAELDEQIADGKRTDLALEIKQIKEVFAERKKILEVMADEAEAGNKGSKFSFAAEKQIADLKRRIILGEADMKQRIIAAETAAAVAAAQKLADIAKRKADKAKAEAAEAKALADEKLGIERNLQDDIARLRIERYEKGHAKAVSLLALEKKIALRGADGDEEQIRLINLKFALMKKALDASKATAAQSTAGTFSSRGLSGLGLGRVESKKLRAAEKTAAATARTAENTAKIAKRKGLVFG